MQPSNGAAPPPSGGPPDANAAARQFAQTISEEDLFQRAQTLFAPFIAYPPNRPMVFVKFGGPEKQAEGDMQMLAFNWLRQERQRNPSCNIHVPEVFKIFSRGGLTFIIMQLVAATPVQQFATKFDPRTWDHNKSRYYDIIAEGVRLLSCMPVPTGATPGPYTRGERRIKHLLFKDHTAPVVYPTIQDLQDHLNRVAERGYRNNPHPPKIALEKELVFCYTDFNDENFMFTTDPDGRPRLYIVDFEHASFLPLSFLAYAVLEPDSRWFLCSWIAKKFGASLPRNNIAVMQRLCYMFQVSSANIGLRKKQLAPDTLDQ
ncbi:hypothetical protein MYCTH_2306164 [Thermothelomyces thermophilus ATCC 42464]|uniref:Uncharacterized protein n=1 Tax=Thermothelomyces thermophilus (strain ATCC 42464 / BCRC 31852 / DSM 1799) TaxID=573729 RepID=G2QH18_THET4|nr:uncharacterized protein MYCTH_2306164 [Thermothelomyces thermophilus ATCC 42464]AEO58678.1 hypothetical protein MYCTH_2306164 [Thermothelomyces thermophilus ATCC 42464]